MHIETTSLVGTIKKTVRAVRNYREDPANINAAAVAAAYYAKKQQRDMVVIAGNSYMCRVYHIGLTTDSLSKFTGIRPAHVVVVKPNGEVYQAVAQ